MKKNGSLLVWILGIISLIVVAGGVAWNLNLFSGKLIQSLPPSTSPFPVGSSSAKVNFVTDGPMDWKISLIQQNPQDIFEDLYIAKGNEKRLLGQVMVYGGQYSLAVDQLKGRIVFVNKSSKIVDQNIDQDIVVYDVGADKVIEKIEWPAIASALGIQGHINASLAYLAISPNGRYAAASFGYILERDWGSSIILADLINGTVRGIQPKGIVSGWKDDKTLQYEVYTDEKLQGSLYNKTAILDFNVD